MLIQGEEFKHIRRLQIKALRNVNDLFAGSYRSVFKGRGLEFEEVREYEPGDDVRIIDWNVTARSQKLYVKNFREELELTVMLVVDISASSRFSHTSQLKSELIAELAALIAFSAIKNQDKVGLLLFSTEVELYIRPKKGLRHVLRVIRELLYFHPQHRGTDLQKALEFLGKVQRKRAICFLISDFIAEDFSKEVAIIAKRHEIIGFQVYDVMERSFIPKATLTLKDLETGEEVIVDTVEQRIREQYERMTHEKQERLKRLFSRIGARFLSINTDEDSSSALTRFFKLRDRKR
jgi:uncharacterized protein (DUF58 family)